MTGRPSDQFDKTAENAYSRRSHAGDASPQCGQKRAAIKRLLPRDRKNTGHTTCLTADFNALFTLPPP